LSTDLKITKLRLKATLYKNKSRGNILKLGFKSLQRDDQQNKLTNSSAVCHTNQHIDFVNRIKCDVTTNKEQRDFQRN